MCYQTSFYTIIPLWISVALLSISRPCISYIYYNASSTARKKMNVNHTFRKMSLGHEKHITLSTYLEHTPLDHQLISLLNACALACADISLMLSRLPIERLNDSGFGGMNVQGEEQKAMDVISNEVFKDHVKNFVAALASEEEERIVIGNSHKYEIAFDPLDGSSNLDVSIATGSIFVSALNDLLPPSQDRPRSNFP